MKISYNWLKTYLGINLPPEKVAEILTNTGLEVEGLEEFESLKGALEGIVVGEVVECSKHPNADRLSVTKVNVGGGQFLPIVCGAPNVAAGQKVAIALPGTTLYSDNESFVIKKSKIRGEVSEGMICAEDELGLGDGHEGIMVLDGDCQPGQALSEIFPVVKDAVFEIGLTPNRIDGACHIGTARDLVAYLNLDEQKSALQIPDVTAFTTDHTQMDIKVRVEETEGCIRYSGVCLDGIEVKESPDWLKIRLQAIGLHPINNIVDITNFVLHETGQPLHAFDADQIAGNQVIVKTMPEGSQFITLDEEDRRLSSTDLMICNAEEAMCMAGVFGGIKSGVSNDTKRIFLESACFNPVWVRKTAKNHGINTDSSFRFERGTDPNGTLYALKRAALLMKEIAGAQIASEIFDIYPETIQPYPVKLSWFNLNRLIGFEIPQDTVKLILNLLDIKIIAENSRELSLEVATYRVDVKREADVIEEILRIYGYNNVGISEQVNSTLSYAPKPDPEALENRIAEQLVGQGFTEIMANSLTKSTYYTDVLNEQQADFVELVNPLSNDLKAMRKTLLFGGLESIKISTSHRRFRTRSFEFGNVYSIKDPQKAFSTKGYHEKRNLGIFITGMKDAESWLAKQEASSFFQLKSVVNSIFERLGLSEEELQVKTISQGIFSEGISYSVQNKLLASFGQVDKKILQTFEIEQDIFFAEIEWTSLLAALNLRVRFKELSKYPEVRRDLALVLEKSKTFEELRQLATQVERKYLKSINLFDVFESEKLGNDKKSYAVSFILQDDNKTLTDKQIDKIMNNLISAMKDKLGAELR